MKMKMSMNMYKVCEDVHFNEHVTIYMDERDCSYKNFKKPLTKWFRKYIFWLHDIRYISIVIFDLNGSPFVILLEGFS